TASVSFTVTFSESVTGVDASDFALTTTGLSGASVTNVSGSGTIYTVTVHSGTGTGTLRLDLLDDDSVQDAAGNALGGTGTGDGTVRLNLLDDDSVQDAAGNRLGGTGAGNGNFTTGQTYTIDKTPSAVVSINRADPDPSNAADVHFTVSFGESVTGVDPSD